MGAEDYLTKPINPVLLKARVDASLEKKRLRDQQRELFSKFATKEVADDLLTTGFALGGKHVEATRDVLRHPLVHHASPRRKRRPRRSSC